MIVVSDTSPFVALAAVGQLGLLPRLDGTVVIPEAVHSEILAGGGQAPGAAEVNSAVWVRAWEPKDAALVESLADDLDAGEAEAIALAVECDADLLLMDERRGRAIAARFGLRGAGVLGVLIEAKHRQMVPAVKPVLDALGSTAGFRIGDALYRRVLEAAGE